MSLIHLQDARLTFGLRPVLDGVNLVIGANERIGLLGRNGEGKSTLLKVFTGEQPLDSGEIHRKQGLRLARLGQEIDEDRGQTVLDVVLEGLGHQGSLLAEYHNAARLAALGEVMALKTLEKVQQAIDAADAWSMDRQAQSVISRMGLDAEALYGPLSGGMKRRVLLAKALVNDPEILLLDEPTNHLDLDAITWLEDFLSKFQGTLVFITHDRRFLKKLSTRILELDRGNMFDWSCGYDIFLDRKQALHEAEDVANAKFDKRLAEEEVWIRKGIKARRTRNEGRVRALKEMREERRQRLARMGTANIQIQEGRGSGTLVAEAVGVDFSYTDRPVIRQLNTVIHRGDRVGIIGPNGSGKTTLVRLLLGELQPQAGRLRTGTNLQIAYFDQHRSQLDDSKTVIDNIGDGRDVVTINGKDKHVLSYLQDFLFTPERARSPVTVLSGGERNRLLLAKLFTRPSNLLVLDEPTNDLDLETLELLEEVISEYKGTILVVSHDRDFINNVVTQCLVLHGDGNLHEFVGDYDDWLRFSASKAAEAKTETEKPTSSEKPRSSRPPKLSYKEARELESLPAEIERLEAQRDSALAEMAKPEYFKQPQEAIKKAQSDLEALEIAIQNAYERWEILESIREAYENS